MQVFEFWSVVVAPLASGGVVGLLVVGVSWGAWLFLRGVVLVRSWRVLCFVVFVVGECSVLINKNRDIHALMVLVLRWFSADLVFIQGVVGSPY